MDPIKLITYVVIAAVVTLLILGGGAFYLGFSAGQFVDGKTSPAPSADVAVAQIEKQNQDLHKQIATLNAEITKLRAARPKPGEADCASQDGAAQSAELEGLREKLAGAQKRLANTGKQYSACQGQVTALKGQLKAVRQREASESNEKGAHLAHQEPDETNKTAHAQPSPGTASTGSTDEAHEEARAVALYERFTLARSEEKDFANIGLRFALNTVASKSVSIGINKQRVTMLAKQGKQISYKNVVCELILLSTDLDRQEAQFSLACKK